MGKKKNSQGPDAILARAEEMFARGNYLLARREFEKAAGITEPGNLAQKIDLCNRKIEEARADDLVKKARKYAGKGDIRAALRSFEEAYAITGEDWIAQKVEQLQKISLSQDLNMSAQEAEAAGDYVKAAELYGKGFSQGKGDDLRAKWARNLVKARKYHDAVSVFQDGNIADVGALYDWGFALACTGEYYACLKVWEKISSMDRQFMEQKQKIRNLLAHDLLAGDERGDKPGAIYQQGRHLLDGGEEQEALGDVVKSSGYAWISELWQSEQFDRVMDVLDSWPFQMDPTLLQVCAKGSFKLAEQSGTRLNELAMYWLPAVYAAQAADGRSALTEGVELREELIRRAESILKRYEGAAEEGAATSLECWNADRKLLEDICGLADGRKKDLHFFICTPRLAARYGISDAIVDLIRKKKKHFKNLERYLNTGAFYSAAGEALYCLEKGDYDKALQSLPEGDAGDEFSVYGIQRVIFGCGLHAMSRGEGLPRGFPERTVALLNQVPLLEKELIDGAVKADKLEELKRFEEGLATVHALKPTKGLGQALSFVMSRRAEEMYNKGISNDKVMATTLRKALALDSKNEHARGLLADTDVDLECAELENAIDGNKMNRACKIAIETKHQKVRDLFFEFFEGMIENLDDVEREKDEKIFVLKRIYGWCARVDDDHDILYDIEEMVEELEEGQRK